MEIKYERCAGIDVHSRMIVVCTRVVEAGEVRTEPAEFGTTTGELLKLAQFLDEHGCTIAAMESTGVYWRPVWHVLEGHLELVLVNARDFHNVPGRKTDVNDSAWLAELLAHGLLRSSLIPPTPQQEVRELTRTSKQLSRERTSHVQRIQKVLETANIKLANVVSDILGRTGRAILEAIVRGVCDPGELAKLRHNRIRATEEEITEALRGSVTDHHRFEIGLHLKLIDALDVAMASIESRLEGALDPYREAAERLKTIPGVADKTARMLVGEIGIEMSRFPSDSHLRSWAGICPAANVSAGKPGSTRIRKAGRWLKPVLIQAALAAIRVKDTYLRAQYHRVRSRRGHQKAIVAVAASMLTAAYHMLKNSVDYKELGGAYFDAHDRAKAAQRHLRRLKELGYAVVATPTPA